MKQLTLIRSGAGVAVAPMLPAKKPAALGGHPLGMQHHLYMQVRSEVLGQERLANQVARAATTVTLPCGAQEVASAVIRTIISAGRAASSVGTVHARVMQALGEGVPVLQVYAHPQRAAAVQEAWASKDAIHTRWERLHGDAGVRDAVLWCLTLPGIGPVTATQLAKDLGWDAVRPEPMLCRLAGIHHRDRMPPTGRSDRCQVMVERLSKASGDPVRQVEAVLLTAGREGILQCDPSGTRISIQPCKSTA